MGTPIGIAWYRREDYERMKNMFADGSVFPETYEKWLFIAQNLYEITKREGHYVVKAYIDPETFPEWCRTHGKAMDADGRKSYAADFATSKKR